MAILWITVIYAYVYIFKCLFWTLFVGGHFENYPDGRSRNSTECTTFFVTILGIERHLLWLPQLEMNEIFFTYTLIYICSDDNDMKKKFFFFQFSRCGYIRLLSALIPDGKYVIFLLVNRECKMLRLASALFLELSLYISYIRIYSPIYVRRHAPQGGYNSGQTPWAPIICNHKSVASSGFIILLGYRTPVNVLKIMIMEHPSKSRSNKKQLALHTFTRVMCLFINPRQIC